MIWGLSAACCVLAVLAGWNLYGRRKLARDMDRMLDEILTGIPLSESDIKEGDASALASKMKRVQEKVELSIGAAEMEKEAVKQLISNMSHQIKTPLAGIMMYCDMLSETDFNPEMQKRCLGKIKFQADKLDQLLNSLFKMVALEQGAIVFEAMALPLKPTLMDAVSSVWEKAERKNISIAIMPFSECTLWHNRKWTAEVFINILENAIKYTKENGRIVIEIRPLELYTEICFTDTGIGIREEELNLIFKRFYRSPEVEPVEGSGIGLALSRLILEQEKGTLTARSQKDEGSTFIVCLQNC